VITSENGESEKLSSEPTGRVAGGRYESQAKALLHRRRAWHRVKPGHYALHCGLPDRRRLRCDHPCLCSPDCLLPATRGDCATGRDCSVGRGYGGPCASQCSAADVHRSGLESKRGCGRSESCPHNWSHDGNRSNLKRPLKRRRQLAECLDNSGAVRAEPKRVRKVDRIPARIPIQIEPTRQSNRVRLRELTRLRRYEGARRRTS
jgi:hypothetical protein